MKTTSEDRKGSFVRWQGITLQQFSFVNNLLIGLSTGILALQLNIAFNNETILNTGAKWLFSFSIVLIFISLAFGCWTALNRLLDFRTTTQVTRKKGKNEQEGIENLREEAKSLGRRSWLLLKLQIVFFGLWALLLLILGIIRLAG